MIEYTSVSTGQAWHPHRAGDSGLCPHSSLSALTPASFITQFHLVGQLCPALFPLPVCPNGRGGVEL